MIFCRYIWAKNAILMTFFTQEKGTLLPEKGQLAKLGGPGPPGPRGSHAPALHRYTVKPCT